MSELLQVIIVVGFGALLRCGYLVGFIVTRNRWREMIKHGIARYNSQTGFWEWEPKSRPHQDAARRISCRSCCVRRR